MLKYFPVLSFLSVLFIILNLTDAKIFIPRYDVVYKNITFTITNKLWTNKAVDEDNPEICSWGKHKFAVNEVYYPTDQCVTIICIEPGKIEALDCGSVEFDEICTSIGMDMGKRHPHCCHRISCTGDNGNKFIYNPLTPGEGDLSA